MVFKYCRAGWYWCKYALSKRKQIGRKVCLWQGLLFGLQFNFRVFSCAKKEMIQSRVFTRRRRKSDDANVSVSKTAAETYGPHRSKATEVSCYTSASLEYEGLSHRNKQQRATFYLHQIENWSLFAEWLLLSVHVTVKSPQLTRSERKRKDGRGRGEEGRW